MFKSFWPYKRGQREGRDETKEKEKELLRFAAIAESGSEHPLAQAVIRKAIEEVTSSTYHLAENCR